MRVLDAGHTYKLDTLDGEVECVLDFVKREGVGYPGNVGSHPGTNLQEVLRACIDRVEYLNQQEACQENKRITRCLRDAIRLLEERAAIRHGRLPDWRLYEKYGLTNDQIEYLDTCVRCGHIGCKGHA